MKKTLLFSVIALVMVGLAVGIFSTNAKAATEGLFTYEIVDGEATITDCDTLASSGELIIPSTLGGYPVTSISHNSFGGFSSSTSVIIPEGVTFIEAFSFVNCANLTSIEIPSSVTSMEGCAIFDCRNLTEINVSNNNDAYCSDNGVLFNKDKTELILYPAGKTEISYKIPSGVTSIDSTAFYSCSSLISIEIPEGVTSISSEFYNCSSLISIVIPKSVTRIGYGVFGECSSLTTVYYVGTEEEWNNIRISSNNDYLLNANIVFVSKSELEIALDGKGVTVGKLADETEVVIVPTVSGNVAMTEAELAEMLGEDITIVSNNGIIGTGSKIIVGEQEVSLIVKGDIDGDGIATVFDALMVKKALANNGFENEALKEFAGDIDGAGVTDSADVDAILAHIVGEMLIA